MKKSPSPLPQKNLFDDYYYSMVPQDDELLEINRRIDFSFVREVVADCYAGYGRPPLDPEMMLRFHFLKDYTGLSDEGLMYWCSRDLIYRTFVGLGGNQPPPDPSSMSVCRTRWGPERMQECVDRVTQSAVEMGFLKQGRAHVDATGVVADVAIRKLRGLVLDGLEFGLKTLKKLDLAELGAPLELEYEALAADSMYWETPERRDAHVLACWQLLERLADVYDGLMERDGWTDKQEDLVLEAAVMIAKVLERRAPRRKSERRDLLVSVHDPDARYSNREKHKKIFAGFKQHIIVDDESQIITRAIVTPANVDDGTQLQALVEQHVDVVGAPPESLAGDSKYFTSDNLDFLDRECIEGFLAVPRAKGEKQGMFGPADFLYDKENDCVMCPRGEIAEGGKWDEKTQGYTYYFRKKQCEGCPLRARCTTSKQGRTVFISAHRDILLAARALKDDPEHLAAQRWRMRIERIFSLQKRRFGLGRTRYRRLNRVSFGVQSIVLVANTTHLVKLMRAEEAAGRELRRLCSRAA